MAETECKPHHFRSWNIKTERRYLKSCWEKCLIKPQSIPAKEIKIEDSEEQLSTMKLNTISFSSILSWKKKVCYYHQLVRQWRKKLYIKQKITFQLTIQDKRLSNREEQNIDTGILASNVAETINVTQILVKSSPDTIESLIYSIKHKK